MNNLEDPLLDNSQSLNNVVDRTVEDSIATIRNIVQSTVFSEENRQSSPTKTTNFPFNNDRDAVSGLIRTFDVLTPCKQTFLVQAFLTRMSHIQHNDVDSFLRAMLRRDFISTLNSVGSTNLSKYILSFLDARTLHECEQCSVIWKRTIENGRLWRRLVYRKVTEDINWSCRLYGQESLQLPAKTLSLLDKLPDGIYKQLYTDVVSDLKSIKANWRNGIYTLKKIHCNSQNSKGVYCLQYDDEKIVSGLRDNTIKIWNKNDFIVSHTLIGHTGSVLCLQYEGDMLITGSSDTTIRVWSIQSGSAVNVLLHHGEAVLHLKFMNNIMVTSSKDRTIAVWDIRSSTDISMKRVLVGHRAAVNVVDFDSRYIVSASGDRTIKMWVTDTCEFQRTLMGHKRGIACLQYQDDLIVSGSSDNTIRIWNVVSGCCIRTLEGHQELVRCIRFNDQYIVSGAYDGKIKVWNLKKALDPTIQSTDIVSSSHDDTILIWDFCSDPLYAGGVTSSVAQHHILPALASLVCNHHFDRRRCIHPISHNVRQAIEEITTSMIETDCEEVEMQS
ncbi:hypothetical protein GJ496_000502 [Pomphorhynchus laevis]|nr:hypothetical protein GJ496_000502 [Pomphorhynchus laevis]